MLKGIGMSKVAVVSTPARIRQTRRRWPLEQKRRIVEATFAAGVSIAQAEALLESVAEALGRVLGHAHPTTLVDQTLLGSVYCAQGKYSQAEAILNFVLPVQRRILGEKHPDTLRSVGALARLYYRQKRYLQSESLFNKVMTVQRRVLGDQHFEYGSTLASFGKLRLRQARFGEAEVLLRDALNIYRRAAPETLESHDCESGLGASLAGQKKYSEAEQWLACPPQSQADPKPYSRDLAPPRGCAST